MQTSGNWEQTVRKRTQNERKMFRWKTLSLQPQNISETLSSFVPCLQHDIVSSKVLSHMKKVNEQNCLFLIPAVCHYHIYTKKVVTWKHLKWSNISTEPHIYYFDVSIFIITVINAANIITLANNCNTNLNVFVAFTSFQFLVFWFF